MVLESACIPIPSEATMLFAGFNVSERRLPAVRAGARRRTAANVVGSWIAYAVGYYGRDRPHREARRQAPHQQAPPRRRPTAGSPATARRPCSSRACCRSCGRSSRCPAGVAKMPFWRFTVFTVLGCLPWMLVLDGHRPRGGRQLGGLEGLAALRRLRGRRPDRRRDRLPRRAPRPARRRAGQAAPAPDASSS